MNDIKIKKDEKKYIEFEIRDNDDAIMNLRGFSATIQLQKYEDSSLSVNTVCTIIDPPEDGICRYFYDGSLSVGIYKAEIEISNTSNIEYITPTFDIEILATLP